MNPVPRNTAQHRVVNSRRFQVGYTVDDVGPSGIGAVELFITQAGALLDGSGLKPSTQGWRLRYEGSRRTVIDGPFTESKELIAGYTLFQARDREEALAWTRRFPNPRGDAFPAEIEVRPLYDLDDFPPGEALRRLSRLDDSM